MANPDYMGKRLRIEKFYSYRDNAGFIGANSASASTGVGGMSEAEVSTLGVGSLVIVAGNEHDWFIPLPRDMNVLHDFGVRIAWSSASTTSSDTYEWITLYRTIAVGAAWAIGTTAMDTTHTVALDVDSGTANARQISTRAAIDGGTFTEAQVAATTKLALNVEMNATDADETINLLGILIDYMPKDWLGSPRAINTLRDQN